MSDPLQQLSVHKTPQNQPIPGRADQVKNNAGGYVFQVDKWQALERFLILGTWGGTYYVDEITLTKDNVQELLVLISENGHRVVDALVDVSLNGRAFKQNPTLFTLALCCSVGTDNIVGSTQGNLARDVRRYAASKVNDVCRTGTMFYQWLAYTKQFRGGGPIRNQTMGKWYTECSADSLALQLVKYRQRDGWTHRDVLRLAKPKVATDHPNYNLIRWVVGKEVEGGENNVHRLITGFLAAQKATTATEWANLITQFQLPFEALPTEALKEVAVWEALVPHMGLTAVLRNLGRMGAINGLVHNASLTKAVNARLISMDEYKKARVHPMQVLLASSTYAAGKGVKGSLSWKTVPTVIDNLTNAFYATFGLLEPTGKRRMLGLDISGSMSQRILNTHLSCRDASAALALCVLNQDNESYTYGFTSNTGRAGNSHNNTAFVDLKMSAKMRLNDAITAMQGHPFGGTDCSLPMRWATDNKVEVDSFEVMTDSETWAGEIHASQALKIYRQKMGIDAKMVVVGMTATSFTIADPNDVGGQMDCVGFDSNVPKVVSQFISS